MAFDAPHGDPSGSTEDERLASLRRAYADALLQGDGAVAEEAISEAIEARYDEPTIDEQVVAPALRLVGDLWAQGALGIGDEHLATEISLRVMVLQREAFRVARRRGRHRILLAAVEGERHDVGLRMAASLLLNAGFDVRMLGPDLPTRSLGPAIVRHEPVVVGLSATMPGSAARLAEAVDVVRVVAPRAEIIAGGRAIDRRGDAQPGVAAAPALGDLVGLVEGLVQRASAN